jgi:hypothetical protein
MLLDREVEFWHRDGSSVLVKFWRDHSVSIYFPDGVLGFESMNGADGWAGAIEHLNSKGYFEV